MTFPSPGPLVLPWNPGADVGGHPKCSAAKKKKNAPSDGAWFCVVSHGRLTGEGKPRVSGGSYEWQKGF